MTTKNKRLTLNDLNSIIGERATFGNSLKAERNSRDMSRREFSALLGITIQSLADIEHGRRIPTPSRAIKIATLIEEPAAYWVQLALQDQLNESKIDLVVTVA